MDCQWVLEKTVREFQEGFECSLSGNRLSIVTPYLYPDNDLVELFIEPSTERHVLVTDLGETMRHLESAGLDPFASGKRRLLVDQIARRLHVEVVLGKLQKEGPSEDVGAMVLDVAAAAIAVADLVYTSRAYEPATFTEEVSLYLTEHGIEHRRDVEVFGDTGRRYHVSLGLNGKRIRPLYVQALSPAQTGQMNNLINRVFRMWWDVDGQTRKMSLLNDIEYAWKDVDLKLLAKVSQIERWSSKELLLTHISQGSELW